MSKGRRSPLHCRAAARIAICWIALCPSTPAEPQDDPAFAALLRYPPAVRQTEKTEPPWRAASGDLLIVEHAPAASGIDLVLPTQIFFAEGFEILADCGNNRFLYRTEGSDDPWIPTSLALAHPHSLTWNPVANRFYADDTDNRRLIAFDSLDSADLQEHTMIKGIPLLRPHDILHAGEEEMLYAVEPAVGRIFRLHDFGDQEEALTLFSGYSRGLTWVDNTLYLVASARGQVYEIHDFAAGDVTLHSSFGKKREDFSGSWDSTGLILNDIERFEDFWYASSFFSPTTAVGTDPDRFKLIRFHTWADFENGTWENLSHLLPTGAIPYFLTLRGRALFLTSLHSTSLSQNRVYRLTRILFGDGFESGDLGGWSMVSSADDPDILNW